ncbi:hypothetical protein BDZ88DRAFT_421299 [Geranomyces variabilis]|nr:hypothetical protein BDZ88DRAFT_421299 [Geranomyces variabilis]
MHFTKTLALALCLAAPALARPLPQDAAASGTIAIATGANESVGVCQKKKREKKGKPGKSELPYDSPSGCLLQQPHSPTRRSPRSTTARRHRCRKSSQLPHPPRPSCRLPRPVATTTSLRARTKKNLDPKKAYPTTLGCRDFLSLPPSLYILYSFSQK